jgi:hypothetical protein
MSRGIAFNASMLLIGFTILLLSIIRSDDLGRSRELQFRVHGSFLMVISTLGVIIAACYPPGFWYSWLGVPLEFVALWLVDRGYIQ